MKVLILYGRAQSANGLELEETSARLGHEVTSGSIMDVSSEISNEASRFWLGRNEITDSDVCFIRSFGPGTCEQLTRRISMIEHMSFSGIHVVNPTYSLRRARDKYSTQYALSEAGLPIATTYTTESMEMAYQRSREIGVSVYKPILSSMGKGSLRFDDPEIAHNAFKMLSRVGMPLIIQEYLENPGRDIRVFVVGGEVVATAIKYGGPGEWKTNVAQGGKMVDEPVSNEILALGVRATNALGLIYSGVDIMETPRGPVVLEANGSPGWQALKAVTGIDVAEKIVLHVAKGN
ncbi:RimK family alpha-L-glutamate ligase [Candidatus Bathyarchaeota archaeon]|nr:RimK family alpha-L-glutamate ligase [Candidatus Bathyarchaeota archaeon]MDP7207569.1 RimK family alpha-L-glutamate ligase [Candidatus Bathyarchaeota archaeon]